MYRLRYTNGRVILLATDADRLDRGTVSVRGEHKKEHVRASSCSRLGGIELNGGQFILWDSSCNKVQTVTLGGTVLVPTLTVTGATPGATYYIQVKYDPDTLKGQNASGKPTVTYLFQTSLNGAAAIPSSGATIKVVLKK